MHQDENPRVVSRRQFMQWSALATASVAVAACAGGSAPAAEAPAAAEAATPTTAAVAAAPASPPGQYNEAPMLAELVAKGELPPVDQRLPTNPTVVEVVDRVGNYGGVMRRGFKGVSDRWGPTKVQDSSIIRYDLALAKHPDLIDSWEINEDASQCTLHLREGLKWSDGTDFNSSAFTWWEIGRAHV